jgi:hypothetical protein
MLHIRIASGLALLVVLSFVSSGPVAEVDPVNRAIDRGVTALKSAMKGVAKEGGQADRTSRGYMRMGEMQVGIQALGVLTLIECGVEPDDPVIQKRLPGLRQESISATHTYSLALLIVLLDRIGDPDDVPLIHSLALRLLAGQYYVGGWSYYCPPNEPDEVKRLTKLLKDRPAVPRERKKDDAERRNPPPLPAEVQDQLKRLERQRRDVVPNPANFQGRGDNSNTQFAVFGLWVARRHGIPIATALAAVEARFRKTQNDDGGWGYVPSARGEANKDTGSTPTITAAGLMVLGMCHAHAAELALRANPKAKDLPDPLRDDALKMGFNYLSAAIGPPGPKAPLVPRPQGRTQVAYYFLWSVERVGVSYHLRTIGTKEWYKWGSGLLVAAQESDGYWQHEYGPVVDTCFALLFLKRVNLVKDLTEELKRLQETSSGSR